MKISKLLKGWFDFFRKPFFKYDIKVVKRVHNVYKEVEEARPKGLKLSHHFDRWHFFYSSKAGEISLVRFLNYFKEGDNFYEIYCLKGNLFEDCERFRKKENAEKRIKELLS